MSCCCRSTVHGGTWDKPSPGGHVICQLVSVSLGDTTARTGHGILDVTINQRLMRFQLDVSVGIRQKEVGLVDHKNI